MHAPSLDALLDRRLSSRYGQPSCSYAQEPSCQVYGRAKYVLRWGSPRACEDKRARALTGSCCRPCKRQQGTTAASPQQRAAAPYHLASRCRVLRSSPTAFADTLNIGREDVKSTPYVDDKVGVLLLNLGGPETLDDVQPFLYNLFVDEDIIRLPPQGVLSTTSC